MTHNHPNCIKFFACLPLLLPFFATAQDIKQESITIDSVSFVAYSKGDTSYSNFISPNVNTVFRKEGKKSVSTLQQSSKYKILVHDSNTIFSSLVLDTGMISLSAADTSSSPSSFRLMQGRAEINARWTWFNGEWIKIPVIPLYPTAGSAVPPEGSLFYTTQTGSLLKSDGIRSNPAYWEYPDGNEINPFVTGTAWAESIGYKNIPLIRVRHPLNVTGIDLGNESLSRDFSIVPYQYGMAIDYNGVVECWVGEWSIHKGNTYRTDVERNNNFGWGGVLWVGDDLDLGGVRATSRNGSDAFYSEVSSEKFSDESHGNLRLRVVNDSDKVSIVHGKRGSKNVSLDIEKTGDTTSLSAGAINSLAFKTLGVQRMLISSDGKVGVNSVQPTSTLDLTGITGYNQLRLRTKYTPATTSDPKGEVGDVSWDDNYIYIKTENGWKRTTLESF